LNKKYVYYKYNFPTRVCKTNNVNRVLTLQYVSIKIVARPKDFTSYRGKKKKTNTRPLVFKLEVAYFETCLFSRHLNGRPPILKVAVEQALNKSLGLKLWKSVAVFPASIFMDTDPLYLPHYKILRISNFMNKIISH